MKRTLQFVVLLVLATANSANAQWDYAGVLTWGSQFPVCASQHQSPIDLDTTTIQYNASLGSLQFLNYNDTPDYTQFNIINNGHSVQVTLLNVSHTIGVSGGGLSNNFVLEQFHFHWGGENEVGSEHTLDGAPYPQEIHLVHFNGDSYDNVSQASNHSDGLAVLGVFVQISDTRNLAFDVVIENFTSIKYENFNLNNIRRFPIELLLPPNAATDFYRYRGSLTTPPCYESVQWTVFRQPLTISADQLEAFRTLLYENTSTTPAELLENNYRPTQPLNGRIVTRSFSNPEAYWTYGTDNGPATWKNTNPMCGWMQQSPINIDTTNTTDKYYDNLKFIGFQSQAGGTRDFNVTNTGHAIELQVGSGFTTSNGGLNGTYTLDKIVFHWGNTASVGSEHTVNSASEPLEIQFVHRQNGYSSIAEASRHEGGLAIVAVFAALSQSTESQTGLNNISNVLPAINTTGGMTTVKSFDLSELLPTNQITFYRYTGSLTSPNCAERVVWTVYSNTISVTVGQAAAFRQTALIGSTVPSSNTRPVQPLNSRVVYRSVLKSNAPFCTGANSAFLLLVALAILAVVFM